MSFVNIRVDLPTHSHSFTVSVSSKSSVLLIKQEIYKTCPGQPRPDGQRLIWRGRLLSDDETVESLWKTDPRIVHLAVHPSAWSFKPSEVSGFQPVKHIPYSSNISSSMPPTTNHHLRHFAFAYVSHQHQTAISSLSPIIPKPNELQNPEFHRLIAKDEFKRNGWSWPDILDVEFPPISEGGLLYAFTMMDRQPYLHLLNPDGKPTARQEHSFRVLTYTFTILYMSIPLPPPVRNVPTQSISIPPHVNQLLQQMGLPPLRVANDNVVQAVPNQDPAPPEIREIPLRPLLASLMMLLFRSLLLLYFVAPTRKPIIGILIFAWMLYEIWQPIRNGLRNGWGVQDQQQQGDNVAGQPQNNNDVAHPNANVGWQPARPNIMAGTLDQQFNAFVDGLANMNMAEEERLLNVPPGIPASEPGVGRQLVTFVGLLISTLHPAIWNRRRVALRRREGTIRTDTNVRNAPLPMESDDSNNEGESRAAQVRDELRARFDRQPGWLQRYIQRVMDEDWVDDSD